MRILLDECLPKDLAGEISGHTVKTVPQAGWASIKNGKLLRLIAHSGKFDVFVTMDKNLPREQKLNDLPFAVVVLRAKSNRLADLAPLVEGCLTQMRSIKPGQIARIGE